MRSAVEWAVRGWWSDMRPSTVSGGLCWLAVVVQEQMLITSKAGPSLSLKGAEDWAVRQMRVEEESWRKVRP